MKLKRHGCSTGHGTSTEHVAELAIQLAHKTRVMNTGARRTLERPRRLANYTVWGRRFQRRKGLAA